MEFVQTPLSILTMRAAFRGERFLGVKIMQTTPRLRSRREAATYLAISQRKLDELTASGELPRVKIGSCVRFEQADLDAFIASQKAA